MNSIKINDKHIFESIRIKNYPKKDKILINRFYALWIEFNKTNDYRYLKNLIAISFKLSVRSALFEQISLILSKHYLKLYNRI